MRNGVGFCVTGSPNDDDLPRATERRRGLGEAERGGVGHDHDVELGTRPGCRARRTATRARPARACAAGWARRPPPRRRSPRRCLSALPQLLRLGGLVDDADPPLRRQLRGQQRTGCRGVRLVDEPEVALEPVDDGGVRAEQRAIAAQQVLEQRTATTRTRARQPRGPRGRAGPTARSAAARGRATASSVRSVARSTRLSKTSDSAASDGERADELRDGQRRQPVGAAAARARRRARRGRRRRAAMRRDVGEPERHLGRDARVDVALPLGALLPGSARAPRACRARATPGRTYSRDEPAQPAPVRAGHRRRHPAAIRAPGSARPAAARTP